MHLAHDSVFKTDHVEVDQETNSIIAELEVRDEAAPHEPE